MKATGMVRRMDELGRIVIPMELRKTLGIEKNDPLEIFVDGNKIIFQKYQPGCIFGYESEDLIQYEGKLISRMAAKGIARAAGLI
jgi:transcriptional pleiotropic regulator of transition state genes